MLAFRAVAAAPAKLTAHADGLGSGREEDSLTAMRSGKRPDRSQLTHFMPRRNMGRMDSAEVHALRVYLRRVPAQPAPG